MPSFAEFRYTSSTGLNSIYAKKCVPDTEPRAVVQIAHGIAEHIDRYDEFMLFLAENGIVAVANDHLGHGKTAQKPEEKGFFAIKNGWNHLVDDMVKLHDKIKAEYPDIPYIMFGHSMGSFLTRTYMIDHPDKYDYAILSGTGHQGAALITSGHALANVLTRMNGVHGDGTALYKLAFGSYLNKIDNPRTEVDWISSDEAAVDKYVADKNCGFICTASVYRDMMGGIKYITDMKNIRKMDMTKPVYFLSGSDDPVGEYGKGVDRAYKAFCKAGMMDVYMKLYPGGRHEMLNEVNKEQVYKDTLDWINSKIQ